MRSYTIVSLAIVVAAVVIAAAVLATSTLSQIVTTTGQEITTTAQTIIAISPSSASIVTTPAMSTTTISTVSGKPSCYPSGESGPFALRIIFDSTQSPVVGAQVRATNQPATVSCNGSKPLSLTNQTTISFTTNYTGWYYLDSAPDAGYSVVVNYLGQNYGLTATFRPEYAYCATLFIPSGKTNSTGREFQSSC